MPDYSSLARERDVYGELGWIPNFNVKLSKNNETRHNNYREYFDTPKDYNVAFTNATVTNQEFFRENAPEASVAHQDSKTLMQSPTPMGVSANSFHNARRSLNSHERISFSAARSKQSILSKTQHQFVLQPDNSNQYRYEQAVAQTIEMPNSIPFLRDVRNTSNQNWKKSHMGRTQDFAVSPQHARPAPFGSPQHQPVRRARSRDQRRRKMKEMGWQGYPVPISQFNEGVHSSNRIPFEKI